MSNLSSPENFGFLNSEKAPQDSTQIVNITAEFDDNTIQNVEKEFGVSRVDLVGSEREYFGIIVYFGEDDVAPYMVNFRTEATTKNMEERRIRILEFIDYLGGQIL